LSFFIGRSCPVRCRLAEGELRALAAETEIPDMIRDQRRRVFYARERWSVIKTLLLGRTFLATNKASLAIAFGEGELCLPAAVASRRY